VLPFRPRKELAAVLRPTGAVVQPGESRRELARVVAVLKDIRSNVFRHLDRVRARRGAAAIACTAVLCVRAMVCCSWRRCRHASVHLTCCACPARHLHVC
jgi:hypothetical protein